MNTTNFTDQVFIVSGTHSGIGKSCADALLNNNAKVIGIDVKEGSISHENYLHYIADVKEEQKIEKTINEVYEKFKRIDGLANCAGTFATSKPFFDINLEEWNRVVETNLTGVFILSKHVARKMINQQNGVIVNISCIRSKVFRPNMADYSSSKGGVVALTSAMALDVAPYNVRVNSVAPGFTYTGMTSKAFDNPEIRKHSEDLIPIGKIANPEDIANVVLFLLSDLSSYINGETIFVDGGFRIVK